jgi:diguanylate cyclase (GGDEF)-like protein/PAS domain S-box-containing protein
MPVDPPGRSQAARLAARQARPMNGTATSPTSATRTTADRAVAVAVSPTQRALLTIEALTTAGIDSPAVVSAPVAIYAVDLGGRVASWNLAAERLFGWAADEIIGEPDPAVDPTDDDDTTDDDDRAEPGAPTVAPTDVTLSPLHRDGCRFHAACSFQLIRDRDGDPTAVVRFVTDTTTETETTRAFEAAHHKWRNLLMNVSDSVTVMDPDGGIRETTGEFTDVLGYDNSSWVGAAGFALIHPDELEHLAELWQQLLQAPGNEVRAIFRMLDAAGHYRLVEHSAVNLMDDPIINGIVVTSRNVDQEEHAKALLSNQAEVLELIARDADLEETLPAIVTLVENHSEGATAVLLLSDDARTLDVGAAGSVPLDALEIVRRSSLEYVTGTTSLDIRRPAAVTDYAADPRLEAFSAALHRLGVYGGTVAPIIENRRGELLGLILQLRAEHYRPSDYDHEVEEVASNLAAIAIERHRRQHKLHYQARHHQLTGLANQSLFNETLDTAIAEAKRRRTTVAVMFIDLDRFKVVNDSLGHAAGDRLLVRFAGRLTNVVRPGDFVGHFGADEFVVILENVTDPEEIRFVAHRLDLALTEPFGLDEGEIFQSVSIGVAMSPEGTDDSETLIQNANAAMFRAKDLGRDRMEVFDADMRIRAAAQLRTDRGLRRAVERSEFVVYYQPKIDLRTGAIIGAEALVRWDHPEHGLILPDRFIAVADDTGVILPIGRWLLEESVIQARSWVEHVPGVDSFLLSVNLSSRQVSAPGLVDHVRRVLEQYSWPADQLLLELTESLLIEDRETTLELLTDLQDLGVKLAIDDFGTGFSSLNFLHRFPVDIVKIDRSFLKNLRADGSGSPVATATIDMAHALGLTTAAKGVEHDGQLAGLRVLDCDLAQGFLIAEALPADAMEELLRAARTW